jgi:hypothetical protein
MISSSASGNHNGDRRQRKRSTYQFHLILVGLIVLSGVFLLGSSIQVILQVSSSSPTITNEAVELASAIAPVEVIIATHNVTVLPLPLPKGVLLNDTTLEEEETTDRSTIPTKIDRIYYFNSFTNPLRRNFMEAWLNQTAISYQRIQPDIGDISPCKTDTCRRILRLSHTYKKLLHHAKRWHNSSTGYYNLSGLTIILHDDGVKITDFGKLLKAIQKLPNDWDVVQLECTLRRTRKKVYPQPCTHSNAIIWRDGTLRRLDPLLKPAVRNFHCLISTKTFKNYCLNMGFTKVHSNNQIGERQTNVVKRIREITEYRASVQHLQRIPPPPNAFGSHPIDRIYYLNLPKNALRKQNMEFWLGQQQSIPYKRIEAEVGAATNQCIGWKQGKCVGISGLDRTLVKLIDQENTTGFSLILEDDFVSSDDMDWSRLQAALHLVPDDWDILRFDCWSTWRGHLDWVNEYVANTSHYRKASSCEWDCDFCGGTHSMLWRGSSVHKLRDMWSSMPYEDADCAITQWGDRGIRSYCINMGLGDLYYIDSELSDIAWE